MFILMQFYPIVSRYQNTSQSFCNMSVSIEDNLSLGSGGDENITIITPCSFLLALISLSFQALDYKGIPLPIPSCCSKYTIDSLQKDKLKRGIMSSALKIKWFQKTLHRHQPCQRQIICHVDLLSHSWLVTHMCQLILNSDAIIL